MILLQSWYAMLNPDSGLYGKVDIDSTFYITAALVPMESSYSGSSYVDLLSYDGASNVSGPSAVPTSGTPYSLQTHSIFPTTYWEWSFKFDGTAGITPYNVADLPDVDPTYNNPPNPGDFYGAVFDLDVSGLLAEGYYVHYDLFGFDAEGKIVKAPFSHDATSAPEPATMLLLGSGLLGFGVFGRKKFKK